MSKRRKIKRDHGSGDRGRALLGLVRNPRAERAFLTLGLETVGDFLDCPKDKLLAIKGFGKRTWQQVWDRVQALATTASVPRSLLPENLRQLPLDQLGMTDDLVRRLAEAGCRLVGDTWCLDPEVWSPDGALGPQVAATLTGALETAVRVGLDDVRATTGGSIRDHETLFGRLNQGLDEQQRQFLEQRIGLGCPPRTRAEIAVGRGTSPEVVLAEEGALRAHLLAEHPTLVARLRNELQRELTAFEGAVDGTRVATGTLAHVLAKGTGDHLLPLRLVVFLFPEQFHLCEGCLTPMPRPLFKSFLRKVQGLTTPSRLPVGLGAIEKELQHIVDPVPRGLLLHVLQRLQHLAVTIDPRRGELVDQSENCRNSRLGRLFKALGRPQSLLDVVFHFRDHYGSASKRAIHDCLTGDDVFLKIGTDLWSLRDWHRDELDDCRLQAEQIADTICSAAERCNVAGLLHREATEREAFLIIDWLRNDARLRYLGRGDFVPREMRHSRAMSRLLKGFKKAMGEMPLARFLGNQDLENRRLVATLLRENRSFVQPNPERVDVLTNYPFNEQRMQRLFGMIDAFLEEGAGYATIERLADAVNRTDLGGPWVTPYLLTDLLRRHSDCELLPGGLVARNTVNLGAWIQSTVRETLRIAADALSFQELLSEAPELAEFGDAVRELMDRDPLVRTRDGFTYEVA